MRTGVTAHTGGGHTFTFLHANQNLSCAGTTCTVTLTSTTAGSLLAFGLVSQNTPAQTFVSISAGGTFVHPGTCSFQSTSNLYVDCGYVLAATGGVTSITVTLSGTFGGAIEIDEVSYTGAGAITLDGTPTGNALTTCTSCAVVPLTITGTSDYVWRMFAVDNTPTNPGGVWTSPANITTTGAIGAVNQTSAATFNVAQTGSGTVAQNVMAFK